MLTFLLTRSLLTPSLLSPSLLTPSGVSRNTQARARYYRVEVAYNLFGEYSVVREWGPKGRRGQHLLVWFSNLREACLAAERWRKRALRRGYVIEGTRL